jgi:hypothetical protein
MTSRGSEDEAVTRWVEPPPARTTTWTGVRDPVVLILVLAGIFDWLSGNPIHSILLFAAAASLLWSALRGAPEETDRSVSDRVERKDGRAKRGLAPVALVAAVLFSIVVGGFVIPGGFALWFAWRRSGSFAPRVDLGAKPRKLVRRGVLAWIGLFVALGLFELVNLLLQPTFKTDSYIHPTLSVMTDPFLASHAGRSTVLFLWLALGWFLVER